jgi:hypothetical protein
VRGVTAIGGAVRGVTAIGKACETWRQSAEPCEP